MPRAGGDQHDELRDAPPHSSRVCPLAQGPKVRLALALELLLAPDVGEPAVEVLDLASEVLDVLALAFLVHFGFSYGDVEVHAHLRGREPAAGVIGLEAHGVVARLVRRECKLALRQTSSVDYFVSAFNFLQECVLVRLGNGWREGPD